VQIVCKEYIAAVDRWMSVLYTYIKPYLYASGGPIIMVQVLWLVFIFAWN